MILQSLLSRSYSVVILVLPLLICCGKSQSSPPEPIPTISYTSEKAFGFVLKYPVGLDRRSSSIAGSFDVIYKHIDLLRNYFPYSLLQEVQKSPLWIGQTGNTAPVPAVYHDSGESLPDEETGKINCVEILDIRKVSDRLESTEPGMLMFYFSLLQYDKLASGDLGKIEPAFSNAKSAGLYKDVDHITESGTVTANSPAMESAGSYFAKLSEAYFSKSDYYPYTYEDLRDYDPAGFTMMQDVWGPVRTKEFISVDIHGFKIMMKESEKDNDMIRQALPIIDRELELVSDSIFSEGVAVLRERPIWLYINDGTGAEFHPNKDWLLENGKLPEMAQCVQVSNAGNFVAWSNTNQPWIILHELSHCLHYFYFGWENTDITAAFNHAKSSGLYHNVQYIDQSGSITVKADAYALTNEKEYFAELTESFFAKNDYFPFIRSELSLYDTTGYRVAKELWRR